MFDKLKNKLNSSTETLSLDITGEHYYRTDVEPDISLVIKYRV